jgi:hypothetical protein
MSVPRLRSAALAIAATVTLAGCAYDGYGYGYGGVSVGYHDGYYYDDPYYGGYGYYDSWYGGGPYYGWYNGFYYPGIGIYIYDRHGKKHRWNDHHRRHWEGRRGGGRHDGRGNWSGYHRRPGSGSVATPDRQAPQARSWRQANPQRQVRREAISRQSPARVARPSSTRGSMRGRSGRHD